MNALGIGSRRDLSDEVAVALCGSETEPASVEMEDRLVRLPIRRVYPDSGNAAESARFEGHVFAWRYVLHETVKLRARFYSLSRSLRGASHGTQCGGDRRISGIQWMGDDRRA